MARLMILVEVLIRLSSGVKRVYRQSGIVGGCFGKLGLILELGASTSGCMHQEIGPPLESVDSFPPERADACFTLGHA